MSWIDYSLALCGWALAALLTIVLLGLLAAVMVGIIDAVRGK